jgi:hypothetical protein
MLVGFPRRVPGLKRHNLAAFTALSVNRGSPLFTVTSPTVPYARTSTVNSTNHWIPWQLCPELQSGLTSLITFGGTTGGFPDWLPAWLISASPKQNETASCFFHWVCRLDLLSLHSEIG